MEDNNNIKELGKKSLEKSFEEKDFLKEGYYKSLGILFFSIASFFVGVGYLFYAYFVYTPPVSYLVLDSDHRVLEEKPLDSFHTEMSSIEQWLNDAFIDIFSYNYINFDKHGVVVSKYFYEKEMPKFMNEFNSLIIQKMLENGKGISTVETLKAFEYQDDGTYGNRKAATFEGIFLIKLNLSEGIKTVRYKVEALVAREKFSIQKDGLIIVGLKLSEG